MTRWELLALPKTQVENLSIFQPASPPSESIRTLSILLFAIAGLIFVVVEGVLVYNLLRFRQTTDEPSSEPPQVYGGTPIEIAWTVAPTLIVCILVLVLARTLWEIDLDPPSSQGGDRSLYVTVIGRQWWWEYRYDAYNGRPLRFITANELHVPAGSDGASERGRVYLNLQSADVVHSFWVPRLAGKTDLIPGTTNRMWFQPSEEGTFYGQCAEYCGAQHAGMLLRVVAEPPAQFERWLAQQEAPAANQADAQAGKAAFLAESCVNCHRVRGTPAAGAYAPDLTHLMSRATLAAGLLPNNPDNLEAWLTNPQQVKTGCLMPAFTFSEERRKQIVHYLATLR